MTRQSISLLNTSSTEEIPSTIGGARKREYNSQVEESNRPQTGVSEGLHKVKELGSSCAILDCVVSAGCSQIVPKTLQASA